jgi:hypothetical protein
MKHRIAFALAIALSAALGGCAQKTDVAATGEAAPPPAASVSAEGSEAHPVAPAIIPPDEAAEPTEPPSYEVAIASAAADRNNALERCAQQPQAVRTQCEQEANAAFADSQAKLQDLRGNQE